MLSLNECVDGEDGEAFIDLIVSDEKTSLEHLEDHEYAEFLERSFMRLSEDRREIIRLKECGASYIEIASRFGITVGTVKSRLSRARDDLRKKVAEMM